MLGAVLYETIAAIAPLLASWERLADLSHAPFAAPGWVLAWWEHVRVAGTDLRVIAVSDGDGELVGIAPFSAVGRHWEIAAASFAMGIAPLALPGREREVARIVAGAALESQHAPATLRLEQQLDAPDWSMLLGEGFAANGRPVRRFVQAHAQAPRIDLDGASYDDWMKSKSGSFRREVRRKQKRIAEAGTTFRYSTAETAERDMGAFIDLHCARRAGIGGSSLEQPGVSPALAAAADALVPSGRLRLLCMEVGGETVAAQLFARAGSTVGAWNSGFDERHAALSPSMQCILHGLSDFAADGVRTVSLGPGAQSYKDRLANGSDAVTTSTLVVSGARGARRAGAALRLRATAKTARARARRAGGGIRQRLPRRGADTVA